MESTTPATRPQPRLAVAQAYANTYVLTYEQWRAIMSKVRPSQDIRSLSEFRANVAAFVAQVRETRRPLVLTQHGRGAAVLLDVEAYEALLDKLALLEDVQVAERELAAGKGVSHAKAAATLRSRVRRAAPRGKRSA